MDKTKNIKFNFDDDGSLSKLKTKYDQFGNDLLNKSKNYGGGSQVQQNKYINDEIKHYKELYEIQKKIYEEKQKSFNMLQREGRQNTSLYSKGKISGDEFEERERSIAQREKELLKGTGRRNFGTYSSEQEKALGNAANNISKFEKLQENTNVLLRQILGQERENALQMIEAFEEGGTIEEKIAAQQAKTVLEGREKKPRAGLGGGGNSLVGDLFTFQGLNSLLGSLKGIFTANSGLDATKQLYASGKDAVISATDITADLIGNYIGKESAEGSKKAAIAGAFKILAKTGARIGGALFDVYSDQLFQAYESRQEFEGINNKNRALTGSKLDNYTMSSAGYSSLDFANANYGVARAMGYGRGSEDQTRGALNLERGFGIGQDISTALLELIRTNKDTDKSLVNIVGGIYSSGQSIFKGDRTYLGEFITKNFSSLQRELLRNQASVNSGTVMDILTRFDKVGGQFSARNGNSTGLISSINNALTNPGSDNMDALTFTALKKSMPGASLGDILREREKGLSSPNYLKAVMGQLEMFGGGEDSQMINLSKALGINYNAATELLRNKDKVMSGSISQSQLKNIYDMPGMADENTNQVQRHTAELTDAKIMGDFEKMFTLINQMQEIIENSYNGATYTINPANGKLTVIMGSTKKPPANQAAVQQQKDFDKATNRDLRVGGFN